MPILPNNTDPLKDYVSGNAIPPLTKDGLVYNQIYPYTGVIDTLSSNNTTGYTDPNRSIINGLNKGIYLDQAVDTYWISEQNFGGPGSAPIILNYAFNSTNYFNFIRFFVLNTPCFVELGWIDSQNNWNAFPGQSTFIVNGGSVLDDINDWYYIEYNADYTLNSNNIALRLTRNKNVQSIAGVLPVNLPYSVGVKEFAVKLAIETVSDVPGTVISGTSILTTQNRFNFIEQYSYQNNTVLNATSSGSNYWKSSPQPTADSIVYFYTNTSQYSITNNQINTNFNYLWSTSDVFNSGLPSNINNYTIVTGTNNYLTDYYNTLNINCKSATSSYITYGGLINAYRDAPFYSSINIYSSQPLNNVSLSTGYFATDVGEWSITEGTTYNIPANQWTTITVTGTSNSFNYRYKLQVNFNTTISGQNVQLAQPIFIPNSTNSTLTQTPQTINRLYINPLYSGCKFNVYYTTATGNADPDTFTWTPVQRDFVLRKGIYDIPTVTCTYLKFEFIQLIPEPYNMPFDSVQRTINVFPVEVEEYYSNLENNIIDGNSIQYSYIGNNNNQSSVNNLLNNSTLFGTASNTVANTNTWPNLSALNASQIGSNVTMKTNTNSYITDPTISYKTIDVNGHYNGYSYNQFIQRRFPNTTVHNYVKLTLDHKWHQAYFAGIQYMTAFYESQFDDLRSTSTSLLSSNGTNSGFLAQDINYVSMNPEDTASTPWVSTIDSFKSFNMGALTSDWNSFLTDSQALMNDPTVTQPQYLTNCTASVIGNLGSSSIVAITPNTANGAAYSIRSATYPESSNSLTYSDANFLTINNWSGVSGTTIRSTPVVWSYNNGLGTVTSGTASGLSVSGSAYTAEYTFTIPGAFSFGTEPWQIQFGYGPAGLVGFGSYNPVGGAQMTGANFYFLVNAQVSGNVTGSGITPNVTTNLSCYTQFINPNTGLAISGTVVSGNTASFVNGSGINNIATLTGTNYVGTSLPSNTIQFVISGSNSSAPFNLYQLGEFPTPTSTWMSPQDRKNTRISGLARIYLPYTNAGTYRVSLFANNVATNTNTELTYKLYRSNSIPLNTWVDIALETFTGNDYNGFYIAVQQTNPLVASEVFYLSLLSPFYHPIRFEYTTISGSTYPNNYQFITGPINDPTYFISTISGVAASGIQLKMTSLDPGTFISGVSIIPYYKQSPYYAELDIDYTGSSKTNEISARRAVKNKPYFQLNKDPHPSRFSLNQIAPGANVYSID